TPVSASNASAQAMHRVSSGVQAMVRSPERSSGRSADWPPLPEPLPQAARTSADRVRAQMDRRDLAGECMRAFQASSGGTGRARHGPGGASVAAWGDDRGWPGEEVGGICQTSVMARLMLLDTASLYFRAFFG